MTTPNEPELLRDVLARSLTELAKQLAKPPANDNAKPQERAK